MPVRFDEYEDAGEAVGWALDPETNAHRVLSFLAENPELGYTPKEIHEETAVPRGSVRTTLRRLEDRGLVRHKEPYWSVDRRAIESYESMLQGIQLVEESTVYDWGDEEPEEYRVGLETVTEAEDDGS